MLVEIRGHGGLRDAAGLPWGSKPWQVKSSRKTSSAEPTLLDLTAKQLQKNALAETGAECMKNKLNTRHEPSCQLNPRQIIPHGEARGQLGESLPPQNGILLRPPIPAGDGRGRESRHNRLEDVLLVPARADLCWCRMFSEGTSQGGRSVQPVPCRRHGSRSGPACGWRELEKRELME